MDNKFEYFRSDISFSARLNQRNPIIQIDDQKCLYTWFLPLRHFFSHKAIFHGGKYFAVESWNTIRGWGNNATSLEDAIVHQVCIYSCLSSDYRWVSQSSRPITAIEPVPDHPNLLFLHYVDGTAELHHCHFQSAGSTGTGTSTSAPAPLSMKLLTPVVRWTSSLYAFGGHSQVHFYSVAITQRSDHGAVRWAALIHHAWVEGSGAMETEGPFPLADPTAASPADDQTLILDAVYCPAEHVLSVLRLFLDVLNHYYYRFGSSNLLRQLASHSIVPSLQVATRSGCTTASHPPCSRHLMHCPTPMRQLLPSHLRLVPRQALRGHLTPSGWGASQVVVSCPHLRSATRAFLGPTIRLRVSWLVTPRPSVMKQFSSWCGGESGTFIFLTPFLPLLSLPARPRSRHSATPPCLCIARLLCPRPSSPLCRPRPSPLRRRRLLRHCCPFCTSRQHCIAGGPTGGSLPLHVRL